MKQFIMLIAAGFVALMLSACGDDQPRQPEVRSDTTIVQPDRNADDVKKADEVNTPASTDNEKPE